MTGTTPVHQRWSQTLVNAGDTLSVSYTITTPATVGSGEDFRVGLFNTLGAAGFAENIDASSSSPNALLNNLPGFSGEFDVNAADADADFALRTHDVNAVNGDGPTGRLLTTTSGFDFRESGDDLGFVIDADTTYTGGLVVTLDEAGALVITQSLVGGSVNETFTANPLLVADDGTDAGVNTLTFDFLGFSVTSGAFGSVNNVGEPDNGFDFNNVTVAFTPVPEPASLALLTSGGTLLLRRRRGHREG